MTEYRFVPPATGSDFDWDDPSIWSGGVVPDGPDADVVLPAGSSFDGDDIRILQTETFSIASLTATANDLSVGGSLSVAGALSLQDADVDLQGGSLSVGSLQIEAGEGIIYGSGNLTSASAIDGAGEIDGSDLTVTAPGLSNTVLVAYTGSLTVRIAAGGTSDLAAGVLTGGDYAAVQGGDLLLSIGGPITTDATAIDLGSDFNTPGQVDAIDAFDPTTGAYVQLQDSLRTVAATGSLTIDQDAYVSANALAVAGALYLYDGASLSTPGLTVAAGGSVTSGGATIAGPIVDDGTILSQGELTLTGAVTGTGTLEIAAANVPLGDTPGQMTTVAELEIGSASSANVRFDSGGGVLILLDPKDFTGTIAPASPLAELDDDIILSGLSVEDVTAKTYVGDADGGVLTLTEGAVSQSLRFTGDYTASSFVLADLTGASSSASGLGIEVAGSQTPTIALSSAPAGSTGGIVDTSLPTVSGETAAGTSVALQADGQAEGTAPSTFIDDTSLATYTATLTAPLGTGLHDITAIQTDGFSDVASATPLPLFVLPDPVAGISTAAVSSAQIGALLDKGFTTRFTAATEAVQLTDGTLSVGPDTQQALLQRLYEGLLDRGGDPGGLTLYNTVLAGQGAASVATALLDSPEYARLGVAEAGSSVPQFVAQMYQDFLGRAPDPAGLAAYADALATGTSRGTVAAAIAGSAEAKIHLAPDTANVWVADQNGSTVTELYATAFGRAPDLSGLAADTKALAAGQTVAQIAAGIAASPEFLADHAGQSLTALVSSFYGNGLGRTPSAQEAQLYAGALQSGVSVGNVLAAIATSPEAHDHLIRTV